MRRAIVAVACLGLAVASVGCGHTETDAAMLRAPQPRTERVELYVAGQATPVRPYYEIALVQAIGFGTDANAEDVAHALTQKAGSLGCDAVIRVYVDVGYSRANASGVCVKYLAPGPAGPPAVLAPRPPANPPAPRIPPAPTPRIEPLPSNPNGGLPR